MKNGMIEEIKDTINRLEEREYMLGMQGKPSIDMPLPKNGEMIKLMIAVCEILTLAYKAGQNQEPYKLAFSDRYITPQRRLHLMYMVTSAKR